MTATGVSLVVFIGSKAFPAQQWKYWPKLNLLFAFNTGKPSGIAPLYRKCSPKLNISDLSGSIFNVASSHWYRRCYY